MTITEPQMSYLKDKYENLIFKISHRISGDNAISDIEDNIQDLWIAAFAAVTGFEKQNGGANGKKEDFLTTKDFDKYLKTCLWNAKNSKGSSIVKKSKVNTKISVYSTHTRKGRKGTDKEAYLNIVDTSPSQVDELNIFDIVKDLSEEEKKIVSEIVSDVKNLQPDGRVNVRKVARQTGWNQYKVNKILSSLSIKLKNKL